MNCNHFLYKTKEFSDIQEYENPCSSKALFQMAKLASAEYSLFQTKPGEIEISDEALAVWIEKAKSNCSPLSYCNFTSVQNGQKTKHPTIAYKLGSIRDDFDFGPLVLIQNETLKAFENQCTSDFKYAGWYEFRLFASRLDLPIHFEIDAYQYSEPDLRASGQKQFDYVNPSNRERQVEMELVATKHLNELNALVAPPFKQIQIENQKFEYEASVLIPVRNRVKTLADAIYSVLNQQTNFKFNLLVIDNHSTDGTTQLIQNINDNRLIHIIPTQTDLGIGGCWDEGINHNQCGRFVVQLDSDDLYSDAFTLQKIVDTFQTEQCALVIGSYRMVNFNLEEIPPGVIDHREWTDSNGPNNALRINGLGAPRAFYTPVIREIGFPNVSYGEDYAVALAISRTWKVGRIYEPIYLCRRWDENTDSNLSIEKMNAHNIYKDSLRTNEIETRQLSNK
jgi:hypothetical protein